MLELKTIGAVMKDRGAYETIAPFVDDTDFSITGQFIYNEIAAYYTQDIDAPSCDREIILARIARKLSNKKQLEQFEFAMDNVDTLDVSAPNITHEFLELKRMNAGDKLAQKFALRADPDEIRETLMEYTSLLDTVTLEASEGEEDETDIIKLFMEVRNDDNKIKLLPGSLTNKLQGGVRSPCSIVVFGRPNSGKSLFTINATAGFLQQGLSVLYVENEDAAKDNRARVVKRLAQMTEEQVRENPELARDKALEAGYANYHLYNASPGTIPEIEAEIKRIRPGVLVINQLRNVHVKSGSNVSNTQNLDKAAQAARMLAKRYGLVVMMVTQAKDPGTDSNGQPKERPVLYMEDVDSSHTGIPGAADLMIGYGVTRDLWQQKMCCLTLAKSKYGGDREYVYCGVKPDIDKLISR